MEKKFIAAPIDNKNVLEDFTEDFHEGHYIEHRNRHEVRQVFFDGDNLWEISYSFGDNHFKLVAIDGALDIKHSAERMKAKILRMRDEANSLYVRMTENTCESTIYGEFLFSL